MILEHHSSGVRISQTTKHLLENRVGFAVWHAGLLRCKLPEQHVDIEFSVLFINLLAFLGFLNIQALLHEAIHGSTGKITHAHIINNELYRNVTV